MGTRIYRNTSSEPLTTFVRRTMRSRQDVLFNFGSFLPKFGCHGNSLGSLEILGSIFDIANPENPTIHAKFESISCTEMKLCLLECLAHLYQCGYRQFCRFLRKIVEIVKKILIKPIKGTRIHGSTSYEVLTRLYDEQCDLDRMFCLILANFFPHLVAMATPLAPLKFWIAYLKSPSPKTHLMSH